MKTITKQSFLIIALLWSSQATAQDANRVLIAAASDLKFALDSVVSSFNREHIDASQIDVTYGSSGKLYEQLSHGAPFDMFFSADIAYPKQLKSNGLTQSEIYPYGKGRIVIWSKKLDPTIKKMNSLLDPLLNKIAIANPTHAPYGKRAEESLQHYKLLSRVEGKLVYGENISQTAQFVTTGAADAGIIALSLALSPSMKAENGKYYLIPESSHKPLEQAFVIMPHGKGSATVNSFRDYMVSEKAKAILSYFGFAELK